MENDLLINNRMAVYMLVYIPVKNKSKIHGVWQDKKKLYFDKLTVKSIDIKDIEPLRVQYEQIAIFYSHGNRGYIKDINGTKVLYNRHILTLQNRPSKNLLTFMLSLYNGVTIYKRKNKYIIVSYN